MKRAPVNTDTAIPTPEELFDEWSKEDDQALISCRRTIIQEMRNRARHLEKPDGIYVDEPVGIDRIFDILKREFDDKGWVISRTSGPKNENYVTVKKKARAPYAKV